MTVTGTFELAFFLADVWSCDNTSDFPLIFHRDLTGDFTAAVQFIQTKCLFISTDLKDRIRRCVDDHMAGCDFFFCQFVQYLGSAGTLITDDRTSGSL